MQQLQEQENPGLQRLDAVLARMDASTLGAFNYREGICRTCPDPAPERQAIWNGLPRGDWQRGECAMCDARQRHEAMERAHARECEKALYGLNVPRLYDAVTLDNFAFHGSAEQRDRQRVALEFSRQFVADFAEGNAPPVVVFHGAPGTGKGHLVWSIAKAVAEQHARRSMVVVLSDVIRDLREAWNRNGDEPSEGERLRKYRGVDLLVVDEVSRHAFFGQPQQHLYDLVANRENHMRPTILTTNEAGSGLAEVLGPALASRAAGWDACIDFGTGDYRMARRAMLKQEKRQAA